jgi:hypothetical protein
MQPFILLQHNESERGYSSRLSSLPILGGLFLVTVSESASPGLGRSVLKSYEWWHLGRAQF